MVGAQSADQTPHCDTHEETWDGVAHLPRGPHAATGWGLCSGPAVILLPGAPHQAVTALSPGASLEPRVRCPAQGTARSWLCPAQPGAAPAPDKALQGSGSCREGTAEQPRAPQTWVGFPHPTVPPSPARTDTMEPTQAHLLSPRSHQCRLRHPHTLRGPRTRSRPPCTGERRQLQAATGSSAARGPHPSRTAPAGETINRDQDPPATWHWQRERRCPHRAPVPSSRRTPHLPRPSARSRVPGPSTNCAQRPVGSGSSPSAHRALSPEPAPVLTAAWSRAGGRAEPGISVPGPGSAVPPVSERRSPESSPEALPTE